MDSLATLLGYSILTLGGLCITALAVIGTALLSNKAVRSLVDTVGGWKVFLEYRKWLQNKNTNKDW